MDNLSRDEEVQNSVCAWIGTKSKQKTKSSKDECGSESAECEATQMVRTRDGGQPIDNGESDYQSAVELGSLKIEYL